MTGYSCPAPGDVVRAGPLLAAPIAKRLYFAGEPTVFLSLATYRKGHCSRVRWR